MKVPETFHQKAATCSKNLLMLFLPDVISARASGNHQRHHLLWSHLGAQLQLQDKLSNRLLMPKKCFLRLEIKTNSIQILAKPFSHKPEKVYGRSASLTRVMIILTHNLPEKPCSSG